MDQARSEEVGRFLDQVPSEHLFITDFAFHSIGVVLGRLHSIDVMFRFVQDAFIDGSVALIHLEPEDTSRLIGVMQQFNLDFDDAYQYTAAERYGLIIVSFDVDFDRTVLGRITPAQVIAQ